MRCGWEKEHSYYRDGFAVGDILDDIHGNIRHALVAATLIESSIEGIVKNLYGGNEFHLTESEVLIKNLCPGLTACLSVALEQVNSAIKKELQSLEN